MLKFFCLFVNQQYVENRVEFIGKMPRCRERMSYYVQLKDSVVKIPFCLCLGLILFIRFY